MQSWRLQINLNRGCTTTYITVVYLGHNFRRGRLDFLLHHNRCQQVKMSLPNHIEKGLTRLMKLFIECATENGRIRIYAWNLCIQFLISQSIQSLTFGV